MSTTNILDLNNRIDELEKNSGGGSADSAKRSDIATEFNTTTAYTAGCYVYHEGKLYQFNTDHAAGAWDPTDVVEANVTDQIVSNKSAIDGLTASDVAYDNTDSGLTATDVQGAVDEVNNRAKAKTFDTPVNITDYTSTNQYYCPYDGYVKTNIRTGGTLYIYVNGVLMCGATSATQQTIVSQYVKKYQYLYCSDVSGNVEASYFPMNN